MNVFMTDAGRFVELQGTAEARAVRSARTRRAAGARRGWNPPALRRCSARPRTPSPFMPVDEALRRLVGAASARFTSPTVRCATRKRRSKRRCATARPATARARAYYRRGTAATSKASIARRGRICATSTGASNGVNQVHFNLQRRTRRRGQADRGDAGAACTRSPRRGSSRRVRMLDRVGRATNDFFEYAGGLTLLSAESAGFIVALARSRRGDDLAVRVARRAVAGDRPAHLALYRHGDLARVGAASRCLRLFGSLVGGAVAYASVRELGPMLTAVVVAGRVGAAIAAELGSMVVTEQIEALRSMGLGTRRVFWSCRACWRCC